MTLRTVSLRVLKKLPSNLRFRPARDKEHVCITDSPWILHATVSSKVLQRNVAEKLSRSVRALGVEVGKVSTRSNCLEDGAVQEDCAFELVLTIWT